MKLTDFPWYDSFQEWPVGGSKGDRRRNERAVIRVPVLAPEMDIDLGLFAFWRAHLLEGRPCNDQTEGIWTVSHFRTMRHDGHLFRSQDPNRFDPPESWEPILLKKALQLRAHHYFMLTSSLEIANYINGSGHAGISVEITGDWYDPVQGVVVPTKEAPIVGTHSFGATAFDWTSRRFEFRNSWGWEWGDGGFGYLSDDMVDRYLVDALQISGLGLFPRLRTPSGKTRLLWTCSSGYQLGVSIWDKAIYGREVVDVDTGERLAWAFARKRDGFLDIEEFFVWPSHRGQGYARLLVEMLRELSEQVRLPLRAWVTHADADSLNRDNLTAAMRLLGLHLHESGVRWAGFVATPSVPKVLPREPYIPALPASTRDNLKPKVTSTQENVDSAASDPESPRLCKVFFGTNRRLIDGKFSIERDSALHVGMCQVEIPAWHKFGEVKSAWWRRVLGIRDGTIRLREFAEMGDDRFWGELNQQIASLPIEDSDSVLFVHGYNVSFEDAACRAAQIGFDLNVPGAVSFFSWPSRGQLLSYPSDEAAIEASEPFLLEFLQRMVEACPQGRLHVIAHSMGNRGLLRVLSNVVNHASALPSFRLGEVILAAPDIDAGHFRNLASCYRQATERTTLYASPRDRALQSSSWLHEFDRAGLTPPVTAIEGIDTIVVPGFNLLDLGHGYFAEAASVLYDMRDVLWNKMEPNRRARLDEKFTPERVRYWELRH